LLILFLSVLQKVNESYPLPLPGARKMRLLAFSLLWPSAIYNLTLHLVLNGESDGAWTKSIKTWVFIGAFAGLSSWSVIQGEPNGSEIDKLEAP
jgi:hypothetical protein